MKYLKLLGWLILYFLVYLLSSILGGFLLGIVYFISIILSGRPFPMERFMAENMTALLIISAILTLFASFIILLIRGYKPLKYLEFKTLSVKHMAITALMGASFAIFINSLMTLIQIDRFLPDYVSESLVDMMTANLFLAFLAIGVLVPIYEEVLVRGLMFKELKANLSLWAALVLQGLIFGLMHGNLLQFSYAFPMGIFLGYVYIKYRSIWAPILIHLVWNSTSLLMGVIMPETISIQMFLVLLICSGVIFASGIIYTIAIKISPPTTLLPEEPV